MESQNAEARKQMAEQLWLLYFNETLYQKGLITETERNRAKLMIYARKSTPKIRPHEMEQSL